MKTTTVVTLVGAPDLLEAMAGNQADVRAWIRRCWAEGLQIAIAYAPISHATVEMRATK